MNQGLKAYLLATAFNPYRRPNIAARFSYEGAASDQSFLTTTALFSGTGTATSTLVTTAFVGVGTAFLSELAAGDTVYNSSNTLIGTILSVTNDTNAVLTANGAAAITGAAFKIARANPRIILTADRSINSAVNGLVLNGANGNWASMPDSAALDIVGDIDLRSDIALPTWTPAAETCVVAKDANDGVQRSYDLLVETNGKLRLVWFTLGTNASAIVADSTVATGFAAFSRNWVRATLDVDNGAVGYDVKFYTSPDGATWTQLGTTVTGVGTTVIFASTAPGGVGAQKSAGGFPLLGTVYSAQIYNGIAGTLAFDANFTTVAKLAASFTESSVNAATVTINTSGDLGARISGARDRMQLTPAKQRTLAVVNGRNRAVSNGVNQYDKSAPFPLIQPTTLYLVGGHTTWTSGDYLIDGNTANSGAIIQTTGTPQLNLNAGSSVAANTGLALGVLAVITAQFNGAASLLGINVNAETTGNAGAGNMGGVTVGASGTPGNYGEGTESELLVSSAADDANLRAKTKNALIKRWGVALP